MRGHLAPLGVVASVLCRVGTCRRGADILVQADSAAALIKQAEELCI